MVEVPEITSKLQWRALLQAAREKSAELPDGRVPWTVLSVLEGRLNAVEAVARSGRPPTQQEREAGMSLGIIALRALYVAAPELCQLLLQLASGFDGWATLPDV